jgi:hypothetical protein
LADLPITLCTGFSELIYENKAKETVIGRYVKKPVVMSEMAPIVRQMLDGIKP